MTGRRAIVGLCMLCALVFSALAAQTAAAASNGTTAFTCKEKVVPGGAGFSKEHCTPADAVASGAKFEHVEIAEETTTEITGGNNLTEGETQIGLLRSTQAGVEEELQAKVVEKKPGTEAWMKNRKDPVTGEHYIEGEGFLTYTEVEVTKPAGKGCKVFEEGATNEKMVTTQKLRATTKGQEMGIKFEPASGTLFAKFTISGCSVAALNGTYETTGSLVAEVNGATISTTEANITTQGNLKLRGQKAGLGGVLTIRGYDEAAGDLPANDKALSATTVATP